MDAAPLKALAAGLSAASERRLAAGDAASAP
jgi:hypothetical protein